MCDREFQNKLTQLFDILGNKTIHELLQHDIQYQTDSEADDKAEKQYLKIRKSLSKRQQKIIDNFIECRTNSNNQYSVICYFAGMKDMYRILAYLKII